MNLDKWIYRLLTLHPAEEMISIQELTRVHLFLSLEWYGPRIKNLLKRLLRNVQHSRMAIMTICVDSTTQAIMRFRQGGLIRHPEDYIDQPQKPRNKVYY